MKNQINWMNHLITPIGMIQHCDGTKPNPEYYFSIDDNARALSLFATFPKIQEKAGILLEYIKQAFVHGPNGFPANYRDKEGNFKGRGGIQDEPTGLEDCYGRSLQALADLKRSNYNERLKEEASTLFDEAKGKSVKNLHWQNPLALTAIAYLTHLSDNKDLDTHKKLENIISELISRHIEYSNQDWQGFSEEYTYAATLPIEAILKSDSYLQNKEALKRAKSSLDFLANNLIRNGTFHPIGSNGWFKKGQRPALYPEQGIEAARLTETCKTAYQIFRENKYIEWAKISHGWFTGNNSDNVSLLGKEGTVYDGIYKKGIINKNCGAESVIAYLISYQALTNLTK